MGLNFHSENSKGPGFLSLAPCEKNYLPLPAQWGRGGFARWLHPMVKELEHWWRRGQQGGEMVHSIPLPLL